MKLIGILFVFTPFLMGLSSQESSCRDMRKGTFTYGEGDHLVRVVFNGKKHTEYHLDGEFVIKSKLEWINECTYKTTLKKSTVPGFDLPRGTEMIVSITKIEGDQYYYTTLLNGRKSTGVFTRID